MNVELMLEMADEIEETERFNMANWFSGGDTFEVLHKCGVTACVAGWALACAGILVDDYENEERDVIAPARRALDIDFFEASRLFYAHYPTSIWARLADEYGWGVSHEGGIEDWEDITAVQAADVLRRIAKYEISL